MFLETKNANNEIKYIAKNLDILKKCKGYIFYRGAPPISFPKKK